MKRYLYLFPLMALTAATLTLGACDDNKEEDTATTETTAPAEVTADTTTTATPEAAPTAVSSLPVSATAATAFATADTATTGAVFVTLQNPSMDTAVKLTGAKTDVAATAEIHETYTDPATGVSEMRKVDSVEIPANGTVTLSATGYHIMLMGLTAPLKEGTPFTLTLTFDGAPEVTVPVVVTPAGASASDGTATTAPSTMPEAPVATEPTTTTPPADATAAPATDEPMATDTTAPAADTSATTTEAPAADASTPE